MQAPMSGMEGGGAPPAGPAKFEGNGNLNQFVDPQLLECLNQSTTNTVQNAFDGASETYLQSDPDTDNQLLISVGFRQPVKISGVIIKVPTGAEDARPAKVEDQNIKVFIGKDDSLDFDEAMTRVGTAEFEQVVLGQEMQVKFVKFQNVSYLKVFIPGSAAGGDQDTAAPTKISALQFIGQPCDALNMKDWKPIKG